MIRHARKIKDLSQSYNIKMDIKKNGIFKVCEDGSLGTTCDYM